MKTQCPCCQQMFDPAPGLSIDLNTNTLITPGQTTKVAPRHAEYVHVLLQADGRLVSRETILTKVYGSVSSAPDCDKIIDVTISQLRKRLKPLGYRIDNAYELGYRLVAATSEPIVKSARTTRRRRLPRVSESAITLQPQLPT